MSKVLTTARGPVAATEADIRKAEAINAMLVRPIAILPDAKGDQIRPFAVGLFDQIRPLMKPEVAATALRRAIGAFVHSKRYYAASAQPDSMRYDIDGSAVEPLSEEDRLIAQKRLAALKAKSDQAAAPPAPEQPPVPPAPSEPVLSKTEQIRAALLSRKRQA